MDERGVRVWERMDERLGDIGIKWMKFGRDGDRVGDRVYEREEQERSCLRVWSP